MLHQNSHLNDAEEGKRAAPGFPFGSLQFESLHTTPQMYAVPPPNSYIPPPPLPPPMPPPIPFLHYNESTTPLRAESANQHINVFVPPYPPPDFQNNAAPVPVPSYVPFSQCHPPPSVAAPYHFDAHFSSTHTQVGAVAYISDSDESKGMPVQKTEVSGDALWIENWLPKQKKEQEVYADKPVRISEVKDCFRKCIHLLKELEKLKEKMSEGYKDMDEPTWNSICVSFLDGKRKVSASLSQLPDITKLQKAIAKRVKKRESQHRRNKRRKESKASNIERRLHLHHQIDTWQKIMQEKIDRSKREESLKKEADSVLSEVLRKKADGRRQLALVTALLKLRQLRAKSAANRGQHVPADDGIRFAKVAENLRELWEKQLKEYNVEEQGMRVMLSEAVDERDQSEATHQRLVLTQWEKLLFGSKMHNIPEFYLAAENSVDAFIRVRQSWDSLAVSSEASVQSNIPVGWVLPSNPSSSDWESFLSSEKSEVSVV